MLHKFFAVISALIITFSLLTVGFTASAEEKCIVKVETVSAITGDEVFVNLLIENNPGIMAMTISITYDPDALKYMAYYYGNVFTDYTVAAHPSRRLIRLVISEKRDLTGDGIIASFKFKVLDDAEYDLHKMTVEYSSGDFCNSDLVRIMPQIVPGGVDVQYNGTNCTHKKYEEWTEKIAPSCDKEGIEQRKCVKCPHTESRNTDPIGHTFSDKFTVDIAATEDMPGIMSRHCIRCNATTEETTFTLDDSQKGEIENKSEAEVPENEVVSGIINEQHPDRNEKEENKKPDSDNTDENINEEEKTEEQIKDILEIISPDSDKDEAVDIEDKLREAIPKIDLIITIITIALIILLVFVLL